MNLGNGSNVWNEIFFNYSEVSKDSALPDHIAEKKNSLVDFGENVSWQQWKTKKNWFWNEITLLITTTNLAEI